MNGKASVVACRRQTGLLYRESTTMNNGSLLLVDDDKFILDAMADYLRGEGHRVETARTARDACTRIGEYRFDVVLCDVNLPDEDGFHVLEFTRTRSPEAAVILI